MDKNASFFTSFNEVEERNIYAIDEFSLDIVGQSDVTF
jgi:hypothetical protein